MPNQSMTNYINSEILRGVSKEEIKQKLLSQGWDEADIAEGMPNDSSKSSKLIPGIIIVVVLVGIIIGVFFFFSKTGTEENSKITQPFACQDQVCFEQHFGECTPATVTIEVFETIAYFYEIIESADNLCKVKSSFTKNPNPDFVGKEMICEYDYSLDFETAIQDMSSCEGQLYVLLTGG